MRIVDKGDQESVDRIIAIGYPDNIEYLDNLLAWTCDPNWPIAGSIYKYFVELGKKEVRRVLKVASNADSNWRYSIIIQIIQSYDLDTLKDCAEALTIWAKQTGSDE
ncbi:MAG: hypothetical protein ACI9SC_001640 [Gammaproteobacteria bacterium]|jgi:hypothetical protein